MMKTHLKNFVGASAVLLLLAFESSYAGTIIKLDLGNSDPPSPDVQFSGGVLSTIDDGIGITTGEQNTAVLYTDFLSFLPPIPGGSFTLHGATPAGPATSSVLGILSQNFSGGSFQIYDSANVKLLDVNMSNSTLLGGPLPVGAFFNINNGLIVGGSLAPLIAANSVNMSMSLSGISGGQLTEIDGVLQAFTANSTNNIVGLPIPEPCTVALLALCGAAAWTFGRRRA
ncbi:MAG TPA: hypothetical protein VFW73_04210 [Lacipirellulaceae bacterium]|nr:hypothetical protein [Lacipirellulaceae bacterium]